MGLVSAFKAQRRDREAALRDRAISLFKITGLQKFKQGLPDY